MCSLQIQIFLPSHNTFYNNKRITQFAYRNAKLIACGEMVKKNLVDYFGFNASQVTVIHNARFGMSELLQWLLLHTFFW